MGKAPFRDTSGFIGQRWFLRAGRSVALKLRAELRRQAAHHGAHGGWIDRQGQGPTPAGTGPNVVELDVHAPAVIRSRATLDAMSGRIRVVVAKPGLDGHDRGAKVVARALRDAGMEVVYTGLHQTPEQIVETVLQEDADAVGLSVLSGAHMTLFARVIELLESKGATDVLVFGGGIIPEQDIPTLTKLGVAKVFTPGATTYEIVDWVRAALAAASAE
ncbi:MAG TPA: cobalamin B12-binding domain-containing protein [Pseudonocardiaceae bacterium]|nr:cobalamin B12-binding domain-containing protein [Pseudonocardiaceae bacterium]